MTHPSNRLDDVVHQRVRLGILALAAPAGSVEFVYLRDALQVTDGNLARHLQVLEDVGYIATRKVRTGGRQKTTVSLTVEGRHALHTELDALRELVKPFDE